MARINDLSDCLRKKNLLLRRSIQHLIPIEVRYEGESDAEENEKPETENEHLLRPTNRPRRTAAITDQLRRLQDGKDIDSKETVKIAFIEPYFKVSYCLKNIYSFGIFC